MVKPVFRRKSIGTKVSEEEYAKLEALAGGRAMSEWVREVLLRELDGRQARPADETLLAEVLALRTILLNALHRLAEGRSDHGGSDAGHSLIAPTPPRYRRPSSGWQQNPAAKEKNECPPLPPPSRMFHRWTRLAALVL